MTTEDELIGEVESYLDREDGRYAILIYGEWGCGKTKFVKEKLKPYMEDRDKPALVVRASAFGVCTGEELMGRIITAIVEERAGIENETKSRGKALKALLKDTGLSTIGSFGSRVFKKMGITYSAPSQLVLSFLLPKRSIVVIDDFERCCAKKHEIFGVVNDLVENHGLNIVFIARNISEEHKDLMEKLVWRKYEFTPDPAKLIEDIMGDAKLSIETMNVQALIARALSSEATLNARLLTRIKPLLEQMISNSFFCSGDVDSLVRESVFSDIVSLVYESAREGGIRKITSESSDPLEKIHIKHANERYEKYRTLKFVGSFVDGSKMESSEEIAAILSSYADMYYPQTAKEVAAMEAVERIRFWEFEDEEGREGLEAIKEAFFFKEVAIANIPKCIRAVKSLMQCDLATKKDLDDILVCSKDKLLVSPKLTLKAFNAGARTEWHTAEGPEELYVPEVEELREEIEKECASRVISLLIEGVNFGSEASGAAIAKNVYELSTFDPMILTKINATVVFQILSASNVASLLEVRRAIYNLMQLPSDFEQQNELRSWLTNLRNCLLDIHVESKTRTFHINCLRGDIDRYLSDSGDHEVSDDE